MDLYNLQILGVRGLYGTVVPEGFFLTSKTDYVELVNIEGLLQVGEAGEHVACF